MSLSQKSWGENFSLRTEWAWVKILGWELLTEKRMSLSQKWFTSKTSRMSKLATASVFLSSFGGIGINIEILPLIILIFLLLLLLHWQYDRHLQRHHIDTRHQLPPLRKTNCQIFEPVIMSHSFKSDNIRFNYWRQFTFFHIFLNFSAQISKFSFSLYVPSSR